MPNDDSDFVVFECFDNAGSAELIKALLESEGVFCIIKAQETIHLAPAFEKNAQGTKLLIHKTDKETASRIVENAKPIVDDETTVVCPKCGSTDVAVKPLKKGFWSGILSFLQGIFGGKNTFLLHCDNCGNDFE